MSDPDATETDTDDERDSDTPVLHKCLQSGGVGAVVEMTNFSLNEFNDLWNVVKEKLNLNGIQVADGNLSTTRRKFFLCHSLL